MLIGFTGAAGCGKSTAAKHLVATYGFVRVRFAGPLKDMLKAIGLTDDHVDGHLKEVPCGLLCGKTPRHAMITLGTEWGRDLIHPTLWTTLWRHQVNQVLDEGGDVVVDDVRFPNEVAALEALGGHLIKVIRPGAELPVINHVSEAGVEGHMSLFNDGPVEILHHRLAGFVHHLPLTTRRTA
jgi:hypothetical protein